MGVELPGVGQYIYEKLTGDATLAAQLGAPTNVFDGVAMPNSTPPWVVYEFQGGSDANGLGARRFITKPLYLIRAIGRTSKLNDLKVIADRIDAVLHTSKGIAGGVTIGAVIREGPYQLTEQDGLVEWRHLGAYFRIYAQ